jgi:hypothetical protein
MGIWGKMGGVYDGVWVWAQDENHSGSDIWAFATMYVRIGTRTSDIIALRRTGIIQDNWQGNWHR